MRDVKEVHTAVCVCRHYPSRFLCGKKGGGVGSTDAKGVSSVSVVSSAYARVVVVGVLGFILSSGR